MNVSVQNGTHAGWRIVRIKRTDWFCTKCDAFNEKCYIRCVNCGARFKEN